MSRASGARAALAQFDDAVDELFDQRLRGRPTADRILYSASALGDFSLIWHFLGAVRGLRSDHHARTSVRLSICLGVESALVNGAIKSLIPRGRPQSIGPRPHRLRAPRTTSFPSGHASAGFMAASLIVDDGGARSVWYPLAAVVALSRVHVRIHHASDVVAGAVLGVALGRVARRAWPATDPVDSGPTVP